MYSLKIGANIPGYLRNHISNIKFNSLSAHDQQFYEREKTIRKPRIETVTVVGKDILGETELQLVDRNICDER